MFILSRMLPAAAEGVAPVLRGRALEIVDDRGIVRADITISPAKRMPDGTTYSDSVILHMMDQNHLIRVKLGADHDGSGLMLADDSQQPGLHVLARSTGSFLKLRNKDGREHLVKP
jgi:hypothetical protein